ncbi:magnesium transporter [Bacteroidota bacterium]
MSSIQNDSKDRHVLPAEMDAGLVEDIASLVNNGRKAMVLNLVADVYPADIAVMLHHLQRDDARELFRWLPLEVASDVLPELDDDFRAAILDIFPADHIRVLLDDMESDEAADVLADLPPELAESVLSGLEDATTVQELLEYPEDTAGGIMGTDFVSVRDNMTVGEATEEVRSNAERVEPIFAVYVVDQDGRLLGTVSLKRLLLSRANVSVSSIIEPDVLSVTPDIDQEEVARLMERYDLVALPVVDAPGRLIGRITIDDVIDVIREEAEEDIQRMSGVRNEEVTSSVMKMTRGRLVWLFVGLLGAFLSALVINQFEGQIEKAVVLAMFIPIVMAMGGNAGIQSSAVAVQGLAAGDLWSSDITRRLYKEIAVALINGLCLAAGISIFVVTMGLTEVIETPHLVRLAITVSITLVTVIVVAASIGSTVPLLLHRIGIDPALATGPFITTSNDLIGLIVYFLIASMVYM